MSKKRNHIEFHTGQLSALLHDPGVVAVINAELQPVLSEARHLAPVDTGAYKAAFRSYVETVKVNGLDRPVGRLENTDRKAGLIESRMGILAKALGGRARGLRRENSRVRAADRKYERQVKREESGGF